MSTNKRKSMRQVRFLFSKGSPLTEPQRTKLKKEIETGKVKVTKSK